MSDSVRPYALYLPGSSVQGVPRPEYWRGLLCPHAGDLPNPGIEPTSLMFPALPGRFSTTSTTWEAPGISDKRVKSRFTFLRFWVLMDHNLFISEVSLQHWAETGGSVKVYRLKLMGFVIKTERRSEDSELHLSGLANAVGIERTDC